MKPETQESQQRPNDVSAEKKTFSPDDYQAECNKPQGPTEADLCQQWRMANAAEKQVDLIAKQYRLQILEVWFLFSTLGLSITAIFLSLFVAMRQLRAYVVIVPGERDSPSGTAQDINTNSPMQLWPILKNVGQTPAYNLTCKSICALLPLPLPEGFDFPLPNKPPENATTLGPQQSRISFSQLDRILTQEELAEIRGLAAPGRRRIYCYGIVQYTDAFGWKRRSKFCYFASWSTTGQVVVVNVGRHNEAN